MRYFSSAKVIVEVISQTSKVQGDRSEAIAKKISSVRRPTNCMQA